jgi:hypothetical protein
MSIKSKIALLKRWIGMATGNNLMAIPQGMGKIYSIEDIQGYYNDLTGKVSKKALLDDDGIPMNKIVSGEVVYFPITIFQYALGLWDYYLLTNKEDYKNSFIKLSNWIVNAQRNDGSWDCFSVIGHSKYTVSAMGQGEAISVLVRIYKMTMDSVYLEAARKAVKFMICEVKEGGTLIIEGKKYIFEEYPNWKEKRVSVLNGWIFSLFGLYDYLKIDDNNHIRDIFNKSVLTLAHSLRYYDTGYWTYYDRIGRIASPAYHELHISLLQALYEISGIETFKVYSDKWTCYKRIKRYRCKAIVKKAIQKLKEKSQVVLVE